MRQIRQIRLQVRLDRLGRFGFRVSQFETNFNSRFRVWGLWFLVSADPQEAKSSESVSGFGFRVSRVETNSADLRITSPLVVSQCITQRGFSSPDGLHWSVLGEQKRYRCFVFGHEIAARDYQFLQGLGVQKLL